MTAGGDTDHLRYLSIAEGAESNVEVRGSKFIGHVLPVETIDEAERFIEKVHETYPKATHHVPAYRVRVDPLREWSSDDGEPSGSAGKPVLNVLRGEELENIVVVVCRYFGGTKLGYGGLVRAYSRVTKNVVNSAKIVEKQPLKTLQIMVDYDDSGTVRRVLNSCNIEFEASYGERVLFSITISATGVEKLRDRLLSATNGRISLDDD